MVGAPEHELTNDNVPYEVGVARFREIARGQILGDETGFMKLIFHREDINEALREGTILRAIPASQGPKRLPARVA